MWQNRPYYIPGKDRNLERTEKKKCVMWGRGEGLLGVMRVMSDLDRQGTGESRKNVRNCFTTSGLLGSKMAARSLQFWAAELAFKKRWVW